MTFCISDDCYKRVGKERTSADEAIKAAQRLSKQRGVRHTVTDTTDGRGLVVATTMPDGWADLTWHGSTLV